MKKQEPSFEVVVKIAEGIIADRIQDLVNKCQDEIDLLSTPSAYGAVSPNEFVAPFNRYVKDATGLFVEAFREAFAELGVDAPSAELAHKVRGRVASLFSGLQKAHRKRVEAFGSQFGSKWPTTTIEAGIDVAETYLDGKIEELFHSKAAVAHRTEQPSRSHQWWTNPLYILALTTAFAITGWTFRESYWRKRIKTEDTKQALYGEVLRRTELFRLDRSFYSLHWTETDAVEYASKLRAAADSEEVARRNLAKGFQPLAAQLTHIGETEVQPLLDSLDSDAASLVTELRRFAEWLSPEGKSHIRKRPTWLGATQSVGTSTAVNQTVDNATHYQGAAKKVDARIDTIQLRLIRRQ